MKTEEILQKRQTLLDEAQGLADKDQPVEEENKRFDACLAEVENLDKEIARLERLHKAKTLPQPQRLTDPVKPELAYTIHETVPATYKRHKPLKGFRDEATAYRCGKWVLATLYNNLSAREWCQRNGMEMLAQSEGVNTAGGWLVPEEFEMSVIDLRETYGVFRGVTRVVPMARDVLTVPRRLGGLTGYFVAENPGSAITESEKTWDAVTLSVKTLATLTRMSVEVAEDALIDLASDLASEIAYAFARKEDDCGFIGDGTSTYGGIHGVTVKINDGNHAGSIVDAASTHTGFETLTLTDFHSVTGKLPDYVRARGNPRWYVSRAGFANSMERLAYAGGGNTVDSLSGGKGLMFLGYPVVIVQVMNSTLGADASKIKVLFGDLSLASMLGSRRGVTVASSDQRYFELNQLALRGTERFDIVVHDLGDASNAGPVVALKSAAS